MRPNISNCFLRFKGDLFHGLQTNGSKEGRHPDQVFVEVAVALFKLSLFFSSVKAQGRQQRRWVDLATEEAHSDGAHMGRDLPAPFIYRTTGTMRPSKR